jgi:SOS response regulatory protein OraA/RecX
MTTTTPSPEDYQHIKDKLYDYLSRQGFSERKLLQKVTDLKRRYPQTKRYSFYTIEHVQKVINELKEQGLIDDRKYAKEVLRQLRDRKDGIHRIREKMHQRMIPAPIIADVLQEWQNSGVKQDYSAVIRDVKRKYERLRKKYPSHKDRYAIQSKLYEFLAQKGYTPDEIKEIISKA